MLRRALIGLLVIPLVDVLLLVWVAGHIGAVATVAFVVLTALVGMLFVRAEGRHTIRQLRRRMAAGEPPTDELLDGALLIAAGALLLTPGLVTDVIGFLLVVPVTRLPIRAAVKRWVVVPLLERETGGFVSGRVYTAGAPFGGGTASTGARSDDGGRPSGETVDLGPDAYRIDIEGESSDDDVEGRANGNA